MNTGTAVDMASIDKHTHYLNNYALKLTGEMEYSKDLYQETIYRALKYKDQFTEGTNLKGWLSTIMYTVFVNDWRREKKRGFVEDPRTNKPVNNTAESDIFIEEVTKLIEKLNIKIRVPFKMYLEGFKYEEIADTLNVPLGTVKSYIFFARKKLKDSINLLFGDTYRDL